MNLNQKMLLCLVILIGNMYYWLTNAKDGMTKVISMLILSLTAYWLGRFHNQKIFEGDKYEKSQFQQKQFVG